MPPGHPDLAARIVAHYRTHGLSWDADRRAAPWAENPWHDRFAASLPIGATVLDLGCGGGWPVAQALVGHGFHVTGVDTSPPLLALCRDRMPGQEWIEADMRTLALGRTFDGILAWDSLFHLTPDAQEVMFPIFAAHAAPGSTLMFNTGPARGEAVGDYRGDPLYHASLDPAEYRTHLVRHGFTLLAHVPEDRSQAGGRTVWLACKGMSPRPLHRLQEPVDRLP